MSMSCAHDLYDSVTLQHTVQKLRRLWTLRLCNPHPAAWRLQAISLPHAGEKHAEKTQVVFFYIYIYIYIFICVFVYIYIYNVYLYYPKEV